MRKGHELDKGVICECCQQLAYKGNYIAISHSEPIVNDTTGRRKIINRYNLCKKCYLDYDNVIRVFMARKSIEAKNKNVDELNRLYKEFLMLN